MSRAFPSAAHQPTIPEGAATQACCANAGRAVAMVDAKIKSAPIPEILGRLTMTPFPYDVGIDRRDIHQSPRRDRDSDTPTRNGFWPQISRHDGKERRAPRKGSYSPRRFTGNPTSNTTLSNSS